MPRRILPMAEEGLFLGLGPWPNVGIDMGLLVFYPPQQDKASYWGYLIYVLDENDITTFIFAEQLVIWFYSKVINFMPLIFNKVKICPKNMK